VTEPLGYAYQRFPANPVAAVPSLHAALPLTLTLVLWRLRPAWSPLAMLYTLLMAPSLVYLGEHYAVDVLAGWGVALAAFTLAWLLELLLIGLRPAAAPLALRLRAELPAFAPSLTLPEAPAWWTATRGALYPGIPLVALVAVLVGPLGYRPSSRLTPPPPPPPCNLLPSSELDAMAGSARELLGPVVVFVAEGMTCHWSDPDRALIEPDAARPVRLEALHRLTTDPDTLWDPVVPEGAVTVRRMVSALEGEEVVHSYAVLLLVLNPADPDGAREQAEAMLDEAANAVRRASGG
jgi:hypothetical protein